jgi:hypothetical protein
MCYSKNNSWNKGDIVIHPKPKKTALICPLWMNVSSGIIGKRGWPLIDIYKYPL